MKLNVDISDAKVSSKVDDVIATYCLGSCIGVTAYDPLAKVGGLLHFQLPSSRTDHRRSEQKPYMFADTGMKLMLSSLTSMGADAKKLKIKLAGGAAMLNDNCATNIGKRNYASIRQLLWKLGLFIEKEDCGGSLPRNLSLNVGDGAVAVKINGKEKRL